MGNELTKKTFNYGWVIVVLFALGTFTYQGLQFQLTILAPDIIGTLGFTPNQFNSVFNSPMLPAIFGSILFGLIVDKFGLKICIAIAMLLSAIGGIGHVYASSYGVMFVTMLLTGVGATAMNVTSNKFFGSWLKKPELISIGMGCFLSASTVGQFVAQSTTAYFDSMSIAFWVSGIMCVVVLVLFIIFGKENKAIEGEQVMEVPTVRETVRVVFKSKNMWLCAFGLFFILGCQMAFNVWLPTALMESGLAQTSAGMITSVVSLGNLCGSLFMPMIAAKVGRDKPFIIGFFIICAAGYAFGWQMTGALRIIILWVSGLCASALMPFFFSMPMKFKEVGPRYAGTATGLISTIELLGAVLLSERILLPLCQSADGILFAKYFYLVGVCWLIGLVLALFIPETGAKARNA